MKIKSIHLKAVVLYLFYAIITKYVFIKYLLLNENFYTYFFQGLISAFFAVLFLYLFDNDNFFSFVKEIEIKEAGNEKKLEKKYLHYGKLFTAVLILAVSGPMVGALAFHFLLKKFKNKYVLLIIISALSSLLWFFIIKKGIIVLL